MQLKLIGGLLAAFVTAATSIAVAQPYPSKPIRLILPYTAGSQADIIGRLVMDGVSEALGQPVIYEPKPGAGGNLAMEYVVKSPADGYTLLLGAPYIPIAAALYKKLSYDPLKDLVPITIGAYGAYTLYTSGTLPVNNVTELVALAKAKPGTLNYFSQGVGTGSQLAMISFALAAGIELTHVPYKGLAQAIPDLVSGQIHLAFNGADVLTSFVDSGQVKMLAMADTQRWKRFPNLPTIAETIPGVYIPGWYGIFAPAGTPPDILAKLNTEMVKAIRLPASLDKIEKLTMVPLPQTLAEAKAYIAGEADRWGAAVRASGAKVEE